MIVVLSLIVLGALSGEAQESESSDDVASGEMKLWGKVVTDPDSTAALGTDEYELQAATITGDTLAIVVSYGGGCEEHLFTLDASEGFMESDPVQLNVALAHQVVNGDPNGDVCTAWITQDYFFQLAPLKTWYRQAYRQDAGSIVLHLKGASSTLVYEFAHADGMTAVENVTWARIKNYSRDE